MDNEACASKLTAAGQLTQSVAPEQGLVATFHLPHRSTLYRHLV